MNCLTLHASANINVNVHAYIHVHVWYTCMRKYKCMFIRGFTYVYISIWRSTCLPLISWRGSDRDSAPPLMSLRGCLSLLEDLVALMQIYRMQLMPRDILYWNVLPGWDVKSYRYGAFRWYSWFRITAGRSPVRQKGDRRKSAKALKSESRPF